jgi:hypothetical protein
MRDIKKLRQCGRHRDAPNKVRGVLLVKRLNDAESLSATLFAEARIWRFET